MADEDEERQLHQLRLLGAGTLVGGLLVVAVATASTKPYNILVVTLAFVGIASLVFEKTQGATVGVSIGFLTSGIIVWLWPYISTADVDFVFTGMILSLVGVVNLVAAPVTLRLRQFGERLGGRSDGGER